MSDQNAASCMCFYHLSSDGTLDLPHETPKTIILFQIESNWCIKEEFCTNTPFTWSKIIWITIWIAIWIAIRKIYPFTWYTHCSIKQSASHWCSLFSHCYIVINLISGLKLTRLQSRSSVYTGQTFFIPIAIYMVIQMTLLRVNWVQVIQDDFFHENNVMITANVFDKTVWLTHFLLLKSVLYHHQMIYSVDTNAVSFIMLTHLIRILALRVVDLWQIKWCWYTMRIWCVKQEKSTLNSLFLSIKTSSSHKPNLTIL